MLQVIEQCLVCVVLLLSTGEVPEGWLFVAVDQGVWDVDLRGPLKQTILRPEIVIEVLDQAITLELHVKSLRHY